MSAAANITVHLSQFPGNIQHDLLESLRTRRFNHKFHYDSVKQTEKWLALHQVHSPSRNDVDCLAIYDQAFLAANTQLEAAHVHLIGLGCGGGQKDTRLLRLLRDSGKTVSYTPCDVSTAMVLAARQTALVIVPPSDCFPFVCDLASADDLPDHFARHGPPDAARLVTFFGMIPNFEPDEIFPGLARLVRPGDTLLFSANLAPGADYDLGIQQILPQYDNPLTRDWLLTSLLDLGVERDDGMISFGVEEGPGDIGLKRIVAAFRFARLRAITVSGEAFQFQPGDSIRLFFSYRYTPRLTARLLQQHGLRVLDAWLTASQEEGVFLCQRA